MKTRHGKIARLPLEIREQLNTRLADGEPGSRLVEWLNSSPAVIKVLREQFGDRPISDQNLSEWRAGGYEEWLTLHSFLDETRVLSENAGEVANTGITSEHLHMVLLAHHGRLLQRLETLPEATLHKKVDSLKKLTASIMNMRRAEQNAERLQIQRERLELLREKHSLKSASSSKAAPSTSRNARPSETETSQSAPEHALHSVPGVPPSADAGRVKTSAPPLPVPAEKSAAPAPPLSGRIQPDFPCLVTHPSSHPVFPATDPLECTARTRCPENSRSADSIKAAIALALAKLAA